MPGFSHPITGVRPRSCRQSCRDALLQDVLDDRACGTRAVVGVVATKDRKTIAIEIETGKSGAVANVRNCLEAGFTEVVSVEVKSWSGNLVNKDASLG